MSTSRGNDDAAGERAELDQKLREAGSTNLIARQVRGRHHRRLRMNLITMNKNSFGYVCYYYYHHHFPKHCYVSHKARETLVNTVSKML